MADELYVLNEGETLPTNFADDFTDSASDYFGKYNTATSTNPFVVTTNGSHSTSENFNYYEVYDGEVSSFGGTTAAINTTSTTNAQETPGYRVQLDTGNVNGFTIDANYHYFVLVYSDSIYKHHFAKYTEQTKYDGTVYNIDFTPRLKENIPSGTQVKIFKGPLVSSSVVAAGYGLTNEIDSALSSTYSTSSFNVAVSSSTLSVGDILISSHFPSGTKITDIVDSSNITVSSQPTSSTTASVTYTTDERHDKFVELSRPTFYFFSGDKLEPNHKYSIVKRLISGGNTVNSHSFFKTAPLTSDYILDKSFFTQNATIVDNNKNLDNQSTPQLRNTYTGSGATYTFSTTTWDDSSRNIYYSDSEHTTYLGFIDSPVRNQLIPNAINIKTNKTLTNRGNYFEARFSDVTKFLDKKVSTNERVEVKEGIKRQNITYLPQAVLPGVYNNHSNPLLTSYITVTGLLENQDLRTLLYNSSTTKYEVILIGDYYYLPSSVSAPSSGSQVIIVADRRAITSSTFEGSTTVDSITDATAFRKEWSPVVNNFITTHSIDIEQVSESISSTITNGSKTITVSSTNLEVGYEVIGTGITAGTTIEEIPNSTSVVVTNSATSSGNITLTYRANKRNNIVVSDLEADINNLEYRIDGTNYGFSIKVKRGDLNNGYVEFEDAPTSSYYNSLDIVSSLKGKLDVNKIIYEGRVETFEKKIENNLHFITISGRDDMSKLLSKPVDKNYLYSEEYIYSTISPYTDTFTYTGIDIQNSNNTHTSNIAVSGTLNMSLNYGDVLYVDFGGRKIMIGIVGASYASGLVASNIQLLNDCFIDTSSDYFGVNSASDTISGIYVGAKKLIAGKSLNTDLRNNKTTTLYGSLDKGYRLLGRGKFLNESGAGEKTQTIERFNSDGQEISNLLITQGSSLDRKDSPLGFDFSEVALNSLTEHEFLSSQTNDETGLLDIQIGYVSPLVLGRMDENENDTFYDGTTVKSLGLYLINSNGIGEGGFIHLLNNENITGTHSMAKGPSGYKNIIMDDRDDTTRVGANYVMRFGSPIFRFNNLTESKLAYSRKYQTTVFANEDKESTFNIYDNNPKSFNFYSSAFRLEGNTIVDVGFHDDGGDSNIQELPLERTGYHPVLGSTGIDITNYPSVFKNSLWHVWPRGYLAKDIMDNKKYFEIDNPSINNTFLFAIGDALPDSKLRRDDIFNQTIGRNCTNYFLLVKYKPVEDSTTKLDHELYKGQSTTKTYRDGDYEYFPIESISNTNPKRMNMLRLRTMTVDSFMNEVDFETYQTKSFPADTEYGRIQICNSIPNSGNSPYPCHTSSATTASTTISVDSNHGIRITSNNKNRYLYTNPADDSTGYSRFLGEATSTSGTGTITLAANCAVVGYSGEIYVVDNTQIPTSPSAVDKFKNEENYIWPDTKDSDFKSHNPNIHKIVRNGTSGSYIYLNNYRKEGALVASDFANRLVKYTGVDITMSNINTTPSYDTARITLSTHGGVSPDLTALVSRLALSSFTVTITGYTGGDAAKNQEYTITAVGSNYLDIRTLALDGLAGMSNDTSAVTCSLEFSATNKYLHNMFANRLWHDGSTNGSTFWGGSVANNSIYTGMSCVVVRNGQPVSAETQAALQPLSIMKNDGFLTDNNYGTSISGSAIQIESDEDAYMRLTAGSKYFADTDGIGGASASSVLEGDNVELLFIPVVDLAASNISTVVGTGISGDTDYDTKKYYIKIEVDYTDMHNTQNSYAGPTSTEHRWINYIGSLTGKYLRRNSTSSPSLHYIVNHHISKRDTDTKFIHYLEIDNGFSFAGTETFDVLTICSKTTQSDKNKINPYEYSQTNVINPITGKFYTKENPNRAWTATSTAAGTLKFFTTGHAKVKGMYVYADLDGMSETLVHRSSADFRASGFFESGNTYSVCLTDGINKESTSMEVGTDLVWTAGGFTPYLYFENMRDYYGSVSIGETITLGTIGKINRPVESVKIVLPFQIQTEAEEIADDIISNAGLSYSKSNNYDTSSKYYIASNFDGQDSFTAVNSVLEYKDLKLLVDGESISIVSNETDKDYRSIQLAEDTTDYNITSFKRDISLYDKFNSVVVIGDNIRGIAKNHTEIKADGAEKVKEIYDFSITGQTQADERARKALKAFSTLSNAIQIEVASDIPHIQPGQIIELKFEREGIFRGDYVIIEVTKESGYPTKLLLGEYTKDLSATLSLLLGETRNLQGRNKQVYKSYASPSIALQKARLKFVKATITSNIGGETVLGFGSTIGFDMGMGL